MSDEVGPDVMVQKSWLQGRARAQAFISFTEPSMKRSLTPDSRARANHNATLVKLGKFVDGRLELFDAWIGDVEYVAVSHVWGKAEWLSIDGVEREVYVSPQKAEFIRSQLPALVGNMPFWMDTLTVDQKNKAEVISVVQIIPAIFRHATKTLALREDDCFYDCCTQCIDAADSWHDIRHKIILHSRDDHFNHRQSESFLLRLWTLQECLLSQTIQFVTCKRGSMQERGEMDSYNQFYRNSMKALDALYALGCSFAESLSYDSETSALAFVRAFLQCSTIRRAMPKERGFADDIFSDNFVLLHNSSDRTASEARDYIFATMPQFPWYHYPLDAKNMTFSAIFLDLHTQAVASNHAFACRLTRSMIESLTSEEDDKIWLPSPSIPEPATLGDFLKLLGRPLQAKHCTDDYHITSAVGVVTVDQYTGSATFELIKLAMRFQPEIWGASHRCGELSKYGSDPENLQKMNRLCTEIHTLTKISSKLSLTPAKRHQWAAELRAQLFALFQTRATDEWIFQQAMKILSLMFCAVDEVTVNKTMRCDWEVVQHEIENHEIDWSSQLQSSISLIAAMVSCQLPLSAFFWVRERFTAVCVQYQTSRLLGLVANHAMPSIGLHATRKRRMVSVGRHTLGKGVGTDLVLADPVTKLPLGLLPDFLYELRSPELYIERMSELYYGIHDRMGPQGFEFIRMPLDTIVSVDRLYWP